jgi:hypothetical protein
MNHLRRGQCLLRSRIALRSNEQVVDELGQQFDIDRKTEPPTRYAKSYQGEWRGRQHKIVLVHLKALTGGFYSANRYPTSCIAPNSYRPMSGGRLGNDAFRDSE